MRHDNGASRVVPWRARNCRVVRLHRPCKPNRSLRGGVRIWRRVGIRIRRWIHRSFVRFLHKNAARKHCRGGQQRCQDQLIDFHLISLNAWQRGVNPRNQRCSATTTGRQSATETYRGSSLCSALQFACLRKLLIDQALGLAHSLQPPRLGRGQPQTPWCSRLLGGN